MSVKRNKTQTRVRVQLSQTEEKVMRMRRGVGADLTAPLEAKTTNPEILAKLRDIEAQLFLDAGQVEPMSKKQHIIDRLKKR